MKVFHCLLSDFEFYFHIELNMFFRCLFSDFLNYCLALKTTRYPPKPVRRGNFKAFRMLKSFASCFAYLLQSSALKKVQRLSLCFCTTLHKDHVQSMPSVTPQKDTRSRKCELECKQKHVFGCWRGALDAPRIVILESRLRTTFFVFCDSASYLFAARISPPIDVKNEPTTLCCPCLDLCTCDSTQVHES